MVEVSGRAVLEHRRPALAIEVRGVTTMVDKTLRASLMVRNAIYLITNLINGKQYVGQTRNFAWYRWISHYSAAKTIKGRSMLIARAINKYGKENFNFEVLEICKSIQELNAREVFWAGEYGTMKPNGYNIKIGNGKDVIMAEYSEERRKNMSNAHKKSERVQAHIRRLAEINKNRDYGQEHGEKARLNNLGKKRSDEWRKNLSIAHKGNNLTDEQKQNVSVALIEARKKPFRYGNRQLTEEQVLEIRNFSDKKINFADLAEYYGVSQSCISSIINRRTWRHI